MAHILPSYTKWRDIGNERKSDLEKNRVSPVAGSAMHLLVVGVEDRTIRDGHIECFEWEAHCAFRDAENLQEALHNFMIKETGSRKPKEEKNHVKK
jgi:hypothetical protein